MNEITLESLGLTRDDICDRVVDRLCGELGSYEDFEGQVQGKVREAVDAAVSKMADEHILPNVHQYLENLCLQETNRWGEAKGKPVTFIEYLVQRAEAWMTEKVDYQGKAKTERDSYSWRENGTRVEFMIHEHLQYSISTAMKQALADANKTIVGGLQEAVKVKLNEIARKLKVEVKT